MFPADKPIQHAGNTLYYKLLPDRTTPIVERIFIAMKRYCLAFALLTGFTSMLTAQPVNRYIVVDQFGYLPASQKIAVIRDPVTGYDSVESFSPGNNYVVVDVESGDHIFRGQPDVWNSGDTDVSSGDRAWHFDFSGVTEEGRYYILDSVNNGRSYEFEISHMVYKEVLKHAVRTFFYQRVGFPKEAQYAGEEWADGASHIGPLQDKNCRLYNAKTDPATERDVSGGWYDAGDYNKYTNWTASYVVEMMKAYIENPGAWGDDYNIPESGNSIPDLLDEAKWGIDHLMRMQQPDGSVLCVVSESHASPPSSATGQSVYGPATTSAAFNTAAAFAIAARVFRSMNMIGYADSLVTKAEKAWDWALENPAVVFHNNSQAYGTQGVAAGDQEEDDYGRSMSKLEASCFLFEATQKDLYQQYFDNNFDDAHLIQWNFAYPYEPSVQDLLLYYTKIPGANTVNSTRIRNAYRNAMVNNSENLPAFIAVKDPYLAHMAEYTWGSNNQKGAQGSMYYNIIQYALDPSRNEAAYNAAQGFIHYLHGVNPFNITYLSNMYSFGGDSCVNEFYHSWFSNGSAKWDRVGTSLYGPPPGFVPGGANPGYNWDGCCETPNCGSAGNNAICASENLTPPLGQPKQKSYKDFNTSWPLNSWSVTENSCGYQVSYLKLLSKFVHDYDCAGDSAGTAYFDTCGICSGGNTGRNPVEILCDCPAFVETEVVQSEDTLTASATDAFFQWLSCSDNQPVIDATGDKFTPVTSGSYAVEVTQNGCIDTSACFDVVITGLFYNTLGKDLIVYPNPTVKNLTVLLPDVYDRTVLEIKNLSGQTMLNEIYTSRQKIELDLNIPSGMYILSIKNNLNQSAIIKLMVE
jgi:endoglucanase